nr:hypothetical protein Q903MT_gene6459 [Picea sitchensis]
MVAYLPGSSGRGGTAVAGLFTQKNFPIYKSVSRFGTGGVRCYTGCILLSSTTPPFLTFMYLDRFSNGEKWEACSVRQYRFGWN